MFLNLINIIKINAKNNRKIIILKKINKKNFNLIKILIKLNIIKYIINKKNKTILILNILKKNKTILKIKNMFFSSNIKILKLNNLKKINKNNSIMVLSTNKGLMNNYDSIKKKTGGIIILYIWN